MKKEEEEKEDKTARLMGNTFFCPVYSARYIWLSILSSPSAKLLTELLQKLITDEMLRQMQRQREKHVLL